MSVTVVEGAGIANGEAGGMHAPRVDRVAACGWVSNCCAAMEQGALTAALTPIPDGAVAASAGASVPHVMKTAMVTRRIASDPSDGLHKTPPEMVEG